MVPARKGTAAWLVATLVAAIVGVAVWVGAAEGDHHRETRLTPIAAPRSAAIATDVVVSPAGDDRNVGSLSSPVRTLRRGLAMVRPGSTLLVRGGTYRERIHDVNLAPGRAEAPIRVKAYPGERVVVKGLLWLHDADFWSIEGINVTWDAERNGSSEHMVKLDGGSGWSFTGAEVWGARSYAAILVTGGASNWRLAGLRVHDTAGVHEANQDHLIYLNGPVSNGVVERSLLYGSPNGRAIKLSGTARGTIIRFNTMADNRGPTNVQLSGPVSGSRIYYNILVRPDAGEANVRTYQLSGGDNFAARNVGWLSTEVVETATGLSESGNLMLDPKFADPARKDFTPLDPRAAAYGYLAP